MTAFLFCVGMEDFLEVTGYLRPLVEKHNVYSLGLALGLRHDRLKAIEHSSDSYLDDVIAEWLRKEGDVVERGEPRWSTLDQTLLQWGIAGAIEEDDSITEVGAF